MAERKERRTGGALRVPFVRRCTIDLPGGASAQAFIVNINVLGAYLAQDELPVLGQGVRCRFRTPGNDLELATEAVVAWVNPRQQHPVHSLPPGFGISFRHISARDRARIEAVVADYVRRNPR